jgi:hypothetical protein
MGERESKKTDGFSRYVERSSFYANIPDNPYSQQYQLINKPPMQIDHPDQLIDGTIQLSNIKDSKTMILYQRDCRLLNRFYDLATRSEGVRSLFNTVYYGWRGELKMTSALEGKERNLQSFLEPEPMTTGFSFLKKRKEKKKKRQLMDYMVPEQQGGFYE